MNCPLPDDLWAKTAFDHIEDPKPIYAYVYLTNNSRNNLLGAYKLAVRVAANESRMTEGQWGAAMRQLPELVAYDAASRWVWIKDVFERRFPRIPHINMVIAVMKALHELREDPTFPFWADFEGLNEGLIKRFQRASEAFAGNGKDHMPQAKELAKYLLQEMSRAVGRKLLAKPHTSAPPIARLLDLGHTPQQIKATIKWLAGPNQQADHRFVVLSGKALRDKWDRIQIVMNKDKGIPPPKRYTL